jgi:mannose/fructose/N-acetylgalactosamine-specific phosphotransferase system component IIB
VSIQLIRIDERLIHGQVVVGWSAATRPDRIVVIDDALAGSEWEQELYLLGLPPAVAAEFVTVEAARKRLEEWRSATDRIILLSRDVTAMTRVAQGGLLEGQEINVGGLHHAPGRRQVLPYVFLSAEDAAGLKQLAGEGAVVTARDLPGARRVPLQQLLGEENG